MISLNLNGSAGENCVKKFRRWSQDFLDVLVFCTKLYIRFSVSQTIFFAPSQELI